LFPPEDPDALSAADLRSLSDPLQAKAMGTAGRDLVEKNFTTKAMMNQIAGAYRNLLSGR